MKSVTPTELRANIYNLLDDVLNTGIPIEIKKAGKKLIIRSTESVDKFKNLHAKPDVINGNPEDLTGISWEKEVNLDLP